MGFSTTTLEPKTAPRKTPSCVSKTASRENFSSNKKFTYKIERNPLKVQQDELDYRYKTASGRSIWPSRDPIAENGGINLYAFVENDSLNSWDWLGLDPLIHGGLKCRRCDSCADLIRKAEWFATSIRTRIQRINQSQVGGQSFATYVGHQIQIATQMLALANCAGFFAIHQPPCTGNIPPSIPWSDVPEWKPIKPWVYPIELPDPTPVVASEPNYPEPVPDRVRPPRRPRPRPFNIPERGGIEIDGWDIFWGGAAVAASGAVIAGQLGPQVAAPEEIITVPVAGAIGGFAALWAASQ